MHPVFEYLVLGIYFPFAALLLIYGLNAYVLVFLYLKNRHRHHPVQQACQAAGSKTLKETDLPFVTTQIPIYNEYNVVQRVIEAACAMDYPKTKHQIQVLDDSTDETAALIDRIVPPLISDGHDIEVIRRSDRTGFKAGALAHGLKTAKGEFIAIFDADFIPPDNFLTQTVGFFADDPQVGLVQARWGHTNKARSLLTQAQSIGIDGHFMIEQSARNWSGLFMNFNGTAGVFRQTAIHDAGGWAWDTLTEDLDLSYRLQFSGWKIVYNPDLVVPAEIPETISAFKSQQFRWAKGSIQTAKKIFPALVRFPCPLFQKVQAVFHLTHYMVHLLMATLAILALPAAFLFELDLPPLLYSALVLVFVFAIFAPSTLYVFSQIAIYDNWLKRILYLPFLVIFGTGIAVSNSRAVIEGLAGIDSPFIRTPKRGDQVKKTYAIRTMWAVFFEMGLGLYSLVSLLVYLSLGNYVVGPFLFIYAAGFLTAGFLGLAQKQ